MSRPDSILPEVKKIKDPSEIQNLDEARAEIARLRTELADKEWAAKKTNQGIRLLYKELEQKTELLRRKSIELERSNRDLEQFAYTASHDLKAPLANILMQIQIILEENEGKLSPESADMLDGVVKSARKLIRLIGDTLEYAKLGLKNVSVEQVDLNETAREAVNDLRAILQQKKALITCDDLPSIPAISHMMKSLFLNLLDNALKYSDPGRACEIHLSAKLLENKEWLFSIRDNGIGMENTERIFEMFQRLHADAEYSGTGVGLALCKKIVLIHGGKIWADSVPGRGSTFFFTLPSISYLGN